MHATRRGAIPYRTKAALAALAGSALLAACALPELPAYDPTNNQRVEWLEQNWKPEDRAWYHHANQGTLTLLLPYNWFMALEQPKLTLFSEAPLLHDDEFLSRIGFILGQRSDYNPDGLPVGFARYQGTDPVSGKPIDGLGLTCAACHSGQLNYNGKAIGIDGGAASTDLFKLTEYLVASMFLTLELPGRFGRFADRVLGAEHSDEAAKTLKAEFKDEFEFVKKQVELLKGNDPHNVAEGYARLDALNRIGNQVFSVEQNLDPANYAALTAPVAYPHIWDTSWFEWVQYDASIMQPMVRNAGEALGVLAAVNMTNQDKPLWASSVNYENIHWMESMLAGLGEDFDSTIEPYRAKAFQGLHAPRWPEEILGPIDQAKATQGEALYQELCQGCHLPPVGSEAFWSDRHWTKTYTPLAQSRNPDLQDTPTNCGDSFEFRWHLLRVPIIPVAKVGTDPAQAEVLRERTVSTPAFLQIASDNFGLALGEVVENVNDHWYASQGHTGPDKSWWEGERPNCLQEPLAYKARPLDGVWATPPFLHNGSVPSIYHLLSPVAERPATFYLGSKEYDPVHLGYRQDRAEGLFELDTSKPGNHNSGHEFNHGKGQGIIGRRLSEPERWALVEYLKTI